jgi:ectoine hydroxylase-related dioxygenase (phytanoyl-CoA dioxygenase family)
MLMDFTDGEVVFIGPQVRTLPLSPASYSWWHPDMPQSSTLHIKLQIYMDDVGPDEGVFSYIPGSHKKEAGPFPSVRWLENMPGHHLLPGRAGTAIIFNCYGWHTAMVNRSQQQRRSIILGYATTKEEGLDKHAFAPISDKLDNPERRKLFRMEN